MTALENIVSPETIHRLGWTLLHFVWQGAAVALVLAILLRLLQKSSANVRYIIACLALALIVLLPVITFHLVSAPEPASHAETGSISVPPLTENLHGPSEIDTPLRRSPEYLETSPSISWTQRARNLFTPALPYIVFGWLIGVLALSAWHVGGWAQLQRLRRKMVKQIDVSLHSKLKDLAERLAVTRPLQLLESALVQVPTVVGWVRPVILLPSSALTGLSTDQLEAMLAHELAHIKRFDYLVNMLQTVVEILGFYHPAVWWVSHKIRAERENCCDDLAVGILGDRVRYARALTSMEQIRASQPELAIAASGGSLLARVRRLVGKESTTYNRDGWLPSAIAIVLILALAIPTTFALTTRPETEAAAERKEEPTKSLHQAAAAGDIERVKSLIAQGADINTTDENGENALHIAARKGNAELTELLLANGAKVDAGNNWATTPLHYASSKEVVELLLANGANVNARNRWDLTPLHCASNKDVADLLLSKGADTETRDGEGWTPLHMAVANGRMDVVERLLARGADISARTDANETLVEWASWEGQLDVKGLLLAKGAEPTPPREYGWTPLHTAAKDGQTKLAQDLIVQGADVHAKNGHGQTPLHVAAANGHRAMVRLLLANGANVNSQARWNDTALFAAARGGHKEVAELLITGTADLNGALLAAAGGGHPNVAEWLIDKGADVNTHAGGGWTPLHRAAFYGQKDFVELLISKGADLNTRAKRWLYTPLHNAVSRGYVDTAKLLIAKGAEINAKDRFGWTPLHYVCQKNDKDTVEFLIAKGADINAKAEAGETPLLLAKDRRHTEIAELLRKHGAKE